MSESNKTHFITAYQWSLGPFGHPHPRPRRRLPALLSLAKLRVSRTSYDLSWETLRKHEKRCSNHSPTTASHQLWVAGLSWELSSINMIGVNLLRLWRTHVTDATIFGHARLFNKTVQLWKIHENSTFWTAGWYPRSSLGHACRRKEKDRKHEKVSESLLKDSGAMIIPRFTGSMVPV